MRLLFWIKTALLFLFRSRRSTLALGVMIFFAVGTLVFISAVAVGVNDCMVLNSTGLYSGHITGTNLSGTIPREALSVKGVSNVLQRYLLPGSLQYQDRMERMTLIAVQPDQEIKSTHWWKKIITGQYLNHETDLLVNSETATQLGLKPGDPVLFTAGSVVYTFIVSGTYQTGINQLDNGIAFCSVAALPQKPENWDCAIFLYPGVSTETVMTAYAGKGWGAMNLKTWQEQMPDLTQLIELNQISMGFVMLLVLGVVSFGTACAFAIFIISNIREYGILKAMGVSPAETALLIFSEVILMNFFACIAGTIAGLAGVLVCSKTGIDLSSFTSHNPYFIVSGLIIPRLTPFILCLPSVLAVLFCLFAAVWPTLIVTRQRTADILRSI